MDCLLGNSDTDYPPAALAWGDARRTRTAVSLVRKLKFTQGKGLKLKEARVT